MLKVLAMLPEPQHFTQIQNKGERFQWADKSTDNLRILSSDPEPWGKEWTVLIRLEMGKTRGKISYPKRLSLVCFPPEAELVKAKIVRDRWSGNFAHSVEPTLLHFAFPSEVSEGRSWTTLAVLATHSGETGFEP